MTAHRGRRTDDVPRLRHDAARRRPAGGPGVLGRGQAGGRRGTSTTLGVGFIEGGWPGANPKDTEFFRRARTELDLRHAQLAAFGATRRPGAKAADDPQVAALRDSGAGVVTLVAKSHARHVELALRTTLEENLAMVRDSVAHLRAEGRRVFLDAEHFFDGYASNPAYAAGGAAGRGRGRCRRRGALRHQRREAARRGGRRRARGARGDQCPARHPLPQRRRLRGRQLARRRRRRRDPRAGHAQRLRRAHRQRRPPHRGRQPGAQAGPAGAAGGPAAGGDPGRARGQRARQRAALQPSAVRRGVRVRAQGRPARQRGPGRPDALPARGPGVGRQRHADARLRHGRPRQRSSSRAASWATTCPATTSCSAGSPTRSRSWRRAATPSRRPTRPSSCCCATRSRAPQPDFFQVESWRVIVDAHGDAHTDGSATSEATVKVRAGGERRGRGRRGQRAGQRARPRAAHRARRRPTPSWPSSS